MNRPLGTKGPEAWVHREGEQDLPILCPLGRCPSHTVNRFSHYLERVEPLSGGGTLAAVMSNPSCPDIGNAMFGKVRNLCDEPGAPFNRIAFLNVFAFRGRYLASAAVSDLLAPAERNHQVVSDVLAQADEVVVAWGSGPPAHLREAWNSELAWFASALRATSVPVLGMRGKQLHPRVWKRQPGAGYRPLLQPREPQLGAA